MMSLFEEEPKRIVFDLPDAEVSYDTGFLPKDKADELFRHLLEKTP